MVRRHLGHEHIPPASRTTWTPSRRGHLSPFVNFHRPSLYATEYVGPKGKVRRKYLREDVKTPYKKLKSLPGADSLLKDGLTFESLDRIAYAQSTSTPPGRSTRPAPSCSGGSARPPRRR